MTHSGASVDVLPTPCSACGGKIVLLARADEPALTARCAHRGDVRVRDLAPTGEAREILGAVLVDRARLLGRLEPARPMILLWLPPSTLSRLLQDALGRLLKFGGEQARVVARRRLGPALRANVDSIDISQSVVADLLKGIDRFEYRGDPA